MQCQRDGRAHIPRIDADRAAQFFGRILNLAEAVGAAAIKINARIPDTDHCAFPDLQRFHMDAFILRAVHCLVQQVPKHECEQVLV